MKYRALVAVAAFLAAIGTAGAADMLIATDTSGCQTYAPYAWVELARGQTWSAEVDLTQCSSEELGWFWVYGHITTGRQSDALKLKHRIVVTAEDMSSKVVYAFSAKSPKSQIMIMTPIAGATKVRLTATNTSNKKKKIRLTWNKAY